MIGRAMDAAAASEKLKRDGYAVHTWTNGPGFWYPVHEHPYQKKIVVLKGSIAFYLPAEKREMVLHQGDHLDIPAHTPHSATVGDDGVECLEGQKSGG